MRYNIWYSECTVGECRLSVRPCLLQSSLCEIFSMVSVSIKKFIPELVVCSSRTTIFIT
jgi:hypothetical protein